MGCLECEYFSEIRILQIQPAHRTVSSKCSFLWRGVSFLSFFPCYFLRHSFCSTVLWLFNTTWPQGGMWKFCVKTMDFYRLGTDNISHPLLSTGAKQECPIKITPDRMVISFNGTGPTATCKQTSTTTTNVKEIYWDVDGSRRTNNESWNADTHEDWNADPVCIATFEGLGTCRKPLNFTLYSMSWWILFSFCHQLEISI